MRDAADATHSLEGIPPKALSSTLALEALLAPGGFIYDVRESKCEIDEGLCNVQAASSINKARWRCP